MASSRLGAFIDFNSSSQISSPPAAAQNYKQDARPSTHELNEIRLQQTSKVAPKPMKPTTSGLSTPPPTPSLLENRLSTPPANDVTEWAADRTVTSWKTKWRLLSCCLVYFGNGMNDSAPAPVTHAIESKLGRSKSYAFAMSLLVGSYVIIIFQPPFPVVVACFFLLGFGMALSLALGNVYCANLPNSITALSCSHGSYGLGATVAPLFATAMVSSGIRWSLFYTVSLAISLINLGFSWWAFLDFENDPPAEFLQPTASRPAAHSEPLTRKRLVKMAIRNRTTLLGALFIFAYQGAEVSTSGWVVSFLISYRHGDPSRVGYVSAGFWAGITVGRFLLGYPAAKLGHKIAVVIMVAGAVAFQLMTWLIPNVVGEAVSVAILGLLLGPVYPSATAVFTQLLPRNMHITSLSFISALGSSGGAVAPFFTGILAQNVGTMVLHPICIGLYGVMATSWLLLPKISKRSE
ncbi:hypothetical protein PMG11_07235 [Penicillium brasilianum]|uniref:Major facilitator superfamily (MFS) profile domain-containing protein n=1 Tax=Penicillium brasilianum TaxID=104259 RepID=A0A0F7TPA4_PENBI|nr:hypothetical protein PMG11_07235 [Penicillium brasilianum]